MSLIIAGLVAAATAAANGVKKGYMGRKSYPECGKKPFWTGKRRRAYDECVENLPRNADPILLPPIPRPGTPPNGSNGPDQKNGNSFFEKNKTELIIGGIGAGIITILLIKK